ncbi:MAG: DUF3830 family protein [Alphaproteobacteria bacterium]|nr:DUF3830 family protein [Alphaproteobacteria bacterium]
MPGASGTINLAVSGVAARAVLWPDFAPKSVAALVRSLPLELPLQHCKWSAGVLRRTGGRGDLHDRRSRDAGDLHLSGRPGAAAG